MVDDNKAVLRVDGLEIEVSEGSMVWCGAADVAGMGEEDAVCCDWAIVPEALQAAFLALRGQWSTMVKAFMEDNREALGVLKEQIHQGYREEREAMGA